MYILWHSLVCSHFPLLPYKEIWCQTICFYFPLLPYKEIVWYFLKLAQSVQIYSNIKGIKEENFKFSVTLHFFFIVSTFMYILWLIKLLYKHFKVNIIKTNKSIEKRSQTGKEIERICRRNKFNNKDQDQGHNMVSSVVILTSLEIAFSTLLGERQQVQETLLFTESPLVHPWRIVPSYHQNFESIFKDFKLFWSALQLNLEDYNLASLLLRSSQIISVKCSTLKLPRFQFVHRLCYFWKHYFYPDLAWDRGLDRSGMLD